MSYTLDTLLDQAADGLQTTVALQSSSVAVLLYAMGFLDKYRNWLDTANDPLDTITDEDWNTILVLVAEANRDLMTPQVGRIFPFATSDPPENTLECDGGVYLRTSFPLLYALLDDAFKIDADTFFVPDIQSRMVIGAGAGSGLSSYGINDQGGEESVTLTTGEMPSHSHTDAGHIHTETAAVPTVIPPGEIPIPLSSATPFPTSTGIGFADIQSTGGDEAHENRPPYIALRWCIQCS